MSPRQRKNALKPVVEAISDPFNESKWKPKTNAQLRALWSGAGFSLFGGAAGSLKSETLLVDACKNLCYPRANSIILRKTYPELEQLISRSWEFLHTCGRWNDQKKVWKLKSGAHLYFGHCQHETDVYKYYGNEYDFIGFDESTFFTEWPVRLLMSRLRSSDPRLQERLKVRLASNPGNVGHMWQQQIFMGPGGCSHCANGNKGRLPFTIYTDARWPSDNKLINMSTQFIPGRLSDHALLGPEYVRQLEGLPAAYAKALKDGCWNMFVGQYFDCWNEERMVVPRQNIKNRSWWNYWISVDYGFSGSTAVAYLFCKSDSGMIYVIGELTAKRLKARDFGVAIRRWWIDPYPDRRLQVCYLSPDAFAHDGGDGHSLAEQMALGAGIMFEKASDRRKDGWMECYTKLDENEIKIADTCELLIKTIPTRVHENRPNKDPDDILKVVNDPGDDAADSFRYGVYSYAQDAERPEQEQIRAAMTSSDPTAAMIQMRMAEARYRKTTEAVDYRGGRR